MEVWKYLRRGEGDVPGNQAQSKEGGDGNRGDMMEELSDATYTVCFSFALYQASQLHVHIATYSIWSTAVSDTANHSIDRSVANRHRQHNESINSWAGGRGIALV